MSHHHKCCKKEKACKKEKECVKEVKAVAAPSCNVALLVFLLIIALLGLQFVFSPLAPAGAAC